MEQINMIEIIADITLSAALSQLGLVSSGRETRGFIENGLISVNSLTVTKADFIISYVPGNYTVIRRGKKKYALIVHL